MAWTRVWQDIESNDQTQSTFDYKALTLDQNCTQVWCAQSDTVAVTTVEATVAAGIPTFGAYYTIGGNFGWLVQQVLAKRNSTAPKLFDVQVTLNRKISFKPDEKDKWACTISIDGQEYSQDAYQDKDAHPVTNSAGEKFDPTLKRVYNDEVISVKYKTLSPPDLSNYRGYVNGSSVSFTIQGYSKSFAARQLKLKNGRTNTTYVDGTSGNNAVWDVDLVFEARKDKFIDQVIDEGYYQRTVATASPNLCGGGGGGAPAGKLVEITDEFQRHLSSPALLDGHGQQLSTGAGAVYLCFPMEPEADFSSLFSGLS
jgi:hypothetical protein